MPRISLFDALRRLPVVIGCVVLAAAQPMSGSQEPAPTPDPMRAPDAVIYPKGSTGASAAPSQDLGYSSPFYLVFAIVVAGAGAWILWKRRAGAALVPGAGKGAKLAIEETRPLGNRQYLVVAAYEGRRFLLGVTTDKIELLTHLPEEGGEE